MLLGRPERNRTYIRKEDFFMGARKRLDGLFQRQPFHSLDIVHQLAHWSADGSHVPELDDLDVAVDRVRHRTEKLVNRDPVSGLFHHLPPGSGNRLLAGIELAFWQDPGLVPSQSHDGDARSGTFP